MRWTRGRNGNGRHLLAGSAEGTPAFPAVQGAGGRGLLAAVQFLGVAADQEAAPPSGDMRLKLRRRDTVVHISWPAAQVQACTHFITTCPISPPHGLPL